jgi:ssDNA-binding Zn-finger/Zn-ribbon topoisomerase 1
MNGMKTHLALNGFGAASRTLRQRALMQVWNEPVAEPCPSCGWPVLTIKTTKRKGTEKVCPQKDCSYSEPFEEG